MPRENAKASGAGSGKNNADVPKKMTAKQLAPPPGYANGPPGAPPPYAYPPPPYHAYPPPGAPPGMYPGSDTNASGVPPFSPGRHPPVPYPTVPSNRNNNSKSTGPNATGKNNGPSFPDQPTMGHPPWAPPGAAAGPNGGPPPFAGPYPGYYPYAPPDGRPPYWHHPNSPPPMRMAPPHMANQNRGGAGANNSGGANGTAGASSTSGPASGSATAPSGSPRAKSANSGAASNAPGAAADRSGPDGATSPTQIQRTLQQEVQIMGCTCKKTQCLKLYCQCFGVKLYCGANCRCLQCHNTAAFASHRKEAMRQILSRNPAAFETKFEKSAAAAAAAASAANEAAATAQSGGANANQAGGSNDKKAADASTNPENLMHRIGCKCRKSACMKKYCECYAGNVKCSPSCRCIGCKNVGPQPGRAPGGTVRPGRSPPSRRVPPQSRSEPFRAAQNLTFLKHGSPTGPPPMPRPPPHMYHPHHHPPPPGHHPGMAPHPGPQHPGMMLPVRPVTSIPSLASSSGGTSPSKSKDEEEDGPDQGVAMSRPVQTAAQPQVVSHDDDDVKTLMMAAYAMTEIGVGGKNQGGADAATTNDGAPDPQQQQPGDSAPAPKRVRRELYDANTSEEDLGADQIATV